MKNLKFESLKNVKFEALTEGLHKITGGYGCGTTTGPTTMWTCTPSGGHTDTEADWSDEGCCG